jgi:hypothetical protein
MCLKRLVLCSNFRLLLSCLSCRKSFFGFLQLGLGLELALTPTYICIAEVNDKVKVVTQFEFLAVVIIFVVSLRS